MFSGPLHQDGMAPSNPRSDAVRRRREALAAGRTKKPGPPPRDLPAPKPRRPARPPLSLRFKMVSSLVILVVVGTGLELTARSMGPQIPMLQDFGNADEIMAGHPTRLWAMSPGVRQNAGATATIHAPGLRGEVPEGPRAPGEERILILGDSSFFGHGVEDEETMAVRLGVGLQDRVPSVAVINGAIPGYSSEQARVMMDDIGWDLEPTLLVIALLWSDNTWDLFRDGDLLKTARTFYNNPLAKSHFYQLLAGAIDRAKGGTGAHIVTWTQESEWPVQGVRRVNVHRFATNMDHLVVEAARRGAGVVFVAPANVEMVDPRRPGESFSWTMYFDAQAAIAAHYSVPVVKLLPSFRAAFEQAAVVPEGDVEPISKVFLDKMHPTPFGHQLMADGVIAALEVADWPTNRLLGMQGPAFDISTVPADSWSQPPGELEKTQSPHGRLYSESPPQYR